MGSVSEPAAAAERAGGLHEIFARRARRRPEAPALVWSAGRLTYGELDARADAWAASLVDGGLAPGARAAIVLPRGADLVCALLATLKTGAAYALLDPAWPAARLASAIDDLAPALVIAEIAGLGDGRAPWRPSAAPATPRPDFRPARVDPRAPCCVFFTSGTTGRPKGALSPHAGTARLFQSGALTDLEDDVVIPLAAPPPWDAFSLELWGALLCGGAAWLTDEPFLSAHGLRRGVRDHGVNTAWLTSSLFNLIVDEDLEAFAGIRRLMIGGERLSPGHVRRFIARHPEIVLINGYGPVESTIFVTAHRIRLEDCDHPEGIPLGRAVPETDIFVLDGARRCGPEAQGEICVAGEGLALGYLGPASPADAAFVHLEIDGRPRRLYRTGDLGRMSRDGRLFYGGRSDRQVKVRGHRVEPAEVERQIEALLPDVRACRVVARRDAARDNVELIAFCAPRRDGDGLEDALARLGPALVAFQRPARLIVVSQFPLTAQGKLDEAALLALAAPKDLGRTDPAASGAGTLGEIRRAFGEVLGRGDLDPRSDFFDAGGDSLQAARACARLGGRLGRAVPVSLLYRHPTALALSAALAQADPGRMAPGPAGARQPLSDLQRLYLGRHLRDGDDRTSHCLLVWTLEGELDLDALEAAIAEVHGRHEALAAAYVLDPAPAVIAAAAPPPPLVRLPRHPDQSTAMASLRTLLAAPLDPCAADVWWCAFAPVADGGVLGCVVHHIAFDGASESILAADLADAYNRAVGGEAPARPRPPGLAQIGARVAARRGAIDIARSLAELRDDLAGVPSLDWPPGAGAPGTTRSLTGVLPAGTVERLRQQAQAAGCGLFAALFRDWISALATTTGQSDFAIGVPLRVRDDAALGEAVGCHLAMGVVRVRAELLRPGRQGLAAVSAALRRAMAAQDAPLDEVLGLAERRDGRPPLFQTLFALQDNPPPVLALAKVRTVFQRQPYLQAPLELHGELWPEADGGLRLDVAFDTSAVPAAAAHRLLAAFITTATQAVSGEVEC